MNSPLALLLLMALRQPDGPLKNVSFCEGLAGWETRGSAGAVIEASQGVLSIRVPGEAAVGWPCVVQGFAVQSGQHVEIRAQAKAAQTSGGYGAYLALEHLDRTGARISWVQSEAVPADATEWVPLRLRSIIPAGITRANVALLLNGHGEAWFRQFALECSEAPEPVVLTGPVTLTVSDQLACSQFQGFGVEDDGWFYSGINLADGITSEDIAIREARIRWMDPDTVRMFFWIHDWCPSHDWRTFTFDSENMESHYRTLAFYQEIKTQVHVVGVEWGVDRPYADPDKAATAIGALLEHLVRVKGFDHVSAWTLSNEPNQSFLRNGSTFDDYVRLHVWVRREIAERELNIRVVGSDDAQDQGWFWRCVAHPEYRQAVDLWSSHRYFLEADRALVSNCVRERLDILQAHGATQPFILTEFGFEDARSTHLQNPVMDTFPYALWTVALVVDGLNSGASGFSIWCLHEVRYPGGGFMNYGLWNGKARDWSPRPVYYAWSMLCRGTEAGDPVYRCASSGAPLVVGVRVGGTLFWVNEAETAVEIRLVGFRGRNARVHTEDTLYGDRECGQVVPLRDNVFVAAPRSFGTVTAH